MFEVITQERLKSYLYSVQELNKLLEQKKKIMDKLGLKGVDYSKDKVTTSNKMPLTEEEEYTNKLLKINAQIEKIKPPIIKEHQILKQQIGRLKKHDYRKLLVYRYIEGWKWDEIKQEFFEFEDDYQENKNDKYHTKIMYWHRRALEELQKVSSKPFIEYKQVAFSFKDLTNDK